MCHDGDLGGEFRTTRIDNYEKLIYNRGLFWMKLPQAGCGGRSCAYIGQFRRVWERLFWLKTVSCVGFSERRQGRSTGRCCKRRLHRREWRFLEKAFEFRDWLVEGPIPPHSGPERYWVKGLRPLPPEACFLGCGWRWGGPLRRCAPPPPGGRIEGGRWVRISEEFRRWSGGHPPPAAPAGGRGEMRPVAPGVLTSRGREGRHVRLYSLRRASMGERREARMAG
jgi:hypothetical protein